MKPIQGNIIKLSLFLLFCFIISFKTISGKPYIAYKANKVSVKEGSPNFDFSFFELEEDEDDDDDRDDSEKTHFHRNLLHAEIGHFQVNLSDLSPGNFSFNSKNLSLMQADLLALFNVFKI